MRSPNGLYQDLELRGLIKQVTDPSLADRMAKGPMTLYAGFDPSADSLHVGHLLPLLTLKRFQLEGHRVIAVVGGATGRIGDPSFKAQERALLSTDTIDKNLVGLRSAIGMLLDLDGKNPAVVVDNYTWFKEFKFLDLLRDVGKHFTINSMIAKESVRTRLEDRDQGISFTEFSYMILQAYDFYHLFKKENCTLQIGGSDQWGNITAGSDLIRRTQAQDGSKEASPVFGMTLPLVLKSDGTKFGKTESGAVWLDPKKTSPYRFYQFWIQTPDTDAMRYLNFFTFLSRDELLSLEKEVKEHPEKRKAQERLAEEMTKLIHGEKELARVREASRALFEGKLSTLDPASFLDITGEAPTTHLPLSRFSSDEGLPLLDLLVECGLVASKGAARKEITAGGIYLNDERVIDPAIKVERAALLHGRYLVLRKGKKTYHFVDLS